MFQPMLAQRAEQGQPIRVGIVGAGKFGAGLAVQLAQMAGIEASIIADLDLDRARAAYAASRVPGEAVTASQTAGSWVAKGTALSAPTTPVGTDFSTLGTSCSLRGSSWHIRWSAWAGAQ